MKTLKQKFNAHLIGLFISAIFIAPAVAEDIEIYVGNAAATVEVKPNLLFIIDTSGSMRIKVNTQEPYDVSHDYSTDSSSCFDNDRIYFSTGDTPTCDAPTDNWFNKTALKCDAATVPLFNEVDPIVTTVITPISDSGLIDRTFSLDPLEEEGIDSNTISSVYEAATETTTTVIEYTQTSFHTDGNRKTVVVTSEEVVSVGVPLGIGVFQNRIAQWKENNDANRQEWLSINNIQKDWFIECVSDFGVHGETDVSSGKYIANRSDGPYTSNENESVSWNAVGRGYILYTANYLNWVEVAPMLPEDESPTRLDVVKEVTFNVVDSSNNINIGLMRFDDHGSSSQGGMITYPVEDVTAARGDFRSRLMTYNPSGYTPLSEVLYESYLYWAGEDVKYGLTSHPSRSIGSSRKDGVLNSEYLSPIEYTCQKNFNILLSDGSASADGDADSEIETLIEGSCVSNCLDELAGYMYTHDVYDGLDEEQIVSTYTVGFAEDHALLRATADAGGAKYFRANNAVELTEVFNKIIAEILSINTTFSSPAVSINAFNRTTHRNDLYFTLFKPAIGPHWNGNLKRFKLVFDDDGVPSIVDNRLPAQSAINAVTGFFDDGAYSWWTPTSGAADGGEVTLGGAAAHISSRTVYTYTGAADPVNVDLSLSEHRFHEDNTSLTPELLNITAADPFDFRYKVVRWARGLDAYDDDGDGSTSDDRKVMGDPLHAEPALVQYGGTRAVAATATDPAVEEVVDITSYVATNDGVLHAINTSNGQEIFSFIPKETLPLQRIVAEDIAGDGKAYGLDGSVKALVIDNGHDGTIDTGDDDKVYLFFGQRRGGNNYFAMDVTDRSNPKLMWVIHGGSGDFAELGQSWSNIQIKKLLINGEAKFVGIFGGGYDEVKEDNAGLLRTTTSSAGDIGRAVYIVDALTGERLWWAGPSGSSADLELSDMKYSIPARMKAVDVRADGYTDRMYVGDMGGQIWRFDIMPGIETGDSLNELISAQRIAVLADGTAEGHRRFYYPPAVAIIAEPGQAAYLALGITSGYRAHPLDTAVHNRIYMVRDEFLYNIPPANSYGSAGTGITESDLFDTTDNDIGQGDAGEVTAAVTELGSKDGWLINLHESDGSYVGEKGLSEALIIDGLLVATTYVPEDASSTVTCEPADGKGYVYFMSVIDAQPQYNFDTVVDSSDNLTAEDRRNELIRGGIPPNPAPIFTEDGSAIIVGTEPTESTSDDRPRKLFWYEKSLLDD